MVIRALFYILPLALISALCAGHIWDLSPMALLAVYSAAGQLMMGSLLIAAARPPSTT